MAATHRRTAHGIDVNSRRVVHSMRLAHNGRFVVTVKRRVIKSVDYGVVHVRVIFITSGNFFPDAFSSWREKSQQRRGRPRYKPTPTGTYED